jgi:predicted PurR-regulated permease PerM
MAVDLDQDYDARAAGSLATVCSPSDEGAFLKTFRQYLPGDDVIQLVIRLGLLAFLIYWTFVLIRPFVPILAWSIVLTVALYPVFDLLSRFLGGRPRLAAAILTLINLGIVVG